MRKKVFIILIIAGVILVSWLYIQAKEVFTIKKLCAEFPSVSGEISCQEAVRIALARYKGGLEAIDQGSGLREVDSASPGQDVWIIEINLDAPIEKEGEVFGVMAVFLDKETGEEVIVDYTW